MGEPDDTGAINFTFDDSNGTGSEVDAETYVSAAAVAFNNAALPPAMPDWLKDTIRADAAEIVQSLQNEEVRRTEARLRRDGEDDNLDAMWQTVARDQREREWDQSRVAVGGIAMSGEEWDSAYELLSDPKMRDRLIQSMKRRKGWSPDRAEKAADDALTLAQIAQRKKDGTITPADEAKAGEITRRNPDAVEMVREAARMKEDRGYGAGADASVSTKSYLTGDVGATTTEYQTLVKASAANVMVGSDPAFTSAPSLISRFDAARDAAVAKPADAPAKPVEPQMVAQLDMNGPF
jgi:hypothetical protein